MSSISDQLRDINIASLKMENGLTLEQILRTEADRLKDCIQKRIDEYYESYEPLVYERTYRFQRSLSVDDVIEIDVAENEMRIYLLFDEELSYHHSIFGGEQGYVPALINDGWSWKNDTIHREHLSYYEGFDYLGKALSDFNKSNPYNIRVEIIRD